MLKNKLTLVCLFLSFSLSEIFAQAEFVYDSKGKRDPFIPLVTSDGRWIKLEEANPQDKTLSLEGIMYDKNGLSYALVNSEAVKVGDRIGDYQVLSIEKNKVTFIREGKTQDIELKKEE